MERLRGLYLGKGLCGGRRVGWELEGAFEGLLMRRGKGRRVLRGALESEGVGDMFDGQVRGGGGR